MPKLPNASGAFIGFDVADYPGDSFMQDWWNNSPYQFVGFYLQAPCHQQFTPWETHRLTLVGMGWSLLVIYVGQQRPSSGTCSQNNLTMAQGTADAIDAAGRASNEGFPAGTFIYLDIETGDPFDTDLADYLQGWVPQIVASGFGVGVYCSRNIANDVNNAIIGFGYATPRVWVFGDGAGANEKFNRNVSVPSDSGVNIATAWQSLTHSQTFGSNTKSVDESVCTLSDPSLPRIEQDASLYGDSQSFSLVEGAGNEIRSVLSAVVEKLAQTGAESQDKRLFFPNGIDAIDIEITVGGKVGAGVSVILKVNGPKS